MRPPTTSASDTPSPLPAEMSDRIGPMLVKELRQGLRTKTFLTAFIGFQVVLLIMVLAGFAAQRNSASGDFLNTAIWSVLMVMLVVITPLRGQFALEKEIRAGTLELLQITNLDAWRIVRGKWGALMGEAMLYLTAALPYFTLRYFLGGVQILTDLALLALTALFSAALTAVVVGLSGFRSVLLRIAIAVGIVALVPMGLSIVEGLRGARGVAIPFSGSNFGDWWGILAGFLLTLAVTGWSFLQLGARTIATQAENHSTSVRLLTLAGIALLVLLDRTSVDPTKMVGREAMPLFFAFALAIYACGIFIALTDNSLQSSRIYIPFIRRGLAPLGRLLLYPGWASGLLYVVLMSIAPVLLRLMSKHPESVLIGLLVCFNFFAQPAAITRILMAQRKVRLLSLSTYITMLVGGAILSSVLLIAELAITNADPIVTMMFPIPAMIGIFESEEGLVIGMQFLSAIVSLGVLVFAAIKDSKFIRLRELRTRDLLANSHLQDRASDPDDPPAPGAGESQLSNR